MQSSLDALVYVQGFDVPLSDADRSAAVLRVDRQVARACGLSLHSVKSNLRSHPHYKRATWLMLYGGALASVGHVLQAHCGSFVLSGWGRPTHPLVRGSHPEMEPGWSSSVVAIRHHGETYTRTDKVQRVAAWPLCQQHLRVCWEHRSDDLNCGECEKCVRTQLELLAAGRLGSFGTFPSGLLVDRIDGVPGITAPHMIIYRGLLERLDEKDIEAREAVTRLLERSPLASPARARGIRRVPRRLVRLLKRGWA